MPLLSWDQFYTLVLTRLLLKETLLRNTSSLDYKSKLYNEMDLEWMVWVRVWWRGQKMKYKYLPNYFVVPKILWDPQKD